MGYFKSADLLLQGAGKSASLISEQLTFEKASRDGGTVQRDKRKIFSRTYAVNGPCDQLFAGPGFSQNQDRRVGGGNHLNLALNPFGVRPRGYVGYEDSAGAHTINGPAVDARRLAARAILAGHRRNARRGDQLPLLRLGEVTVDLTKRSAQGPGGVLHLTPLELRVLDALARNAGMIVTQAQLIREAWGPDRLGDTRGLRSYIKMLRQKLEPDPTQPRYLITETGVGYRLMVDNDESYAIKAAITDKSA